MIDPPRKHRLHRCISLIVHGVIGCLVMWGGGSHSAISEANAEGQKSKRVVYVSRSHRIDRTKTTLPHAFSPSNKRSHLRKLLAKKLDQMLRHRKLKGARIGLVVMTPNGEILYQRKAKQLFIPASNTKLFTIAAALRILGPSYRYSTKIYGDRPIDAKGVLRGNLYIKGSGDPMLRSEEMWRITRDLYNMGLRKVTGHVKFDDSRFDQKRFGKGWKDHNHERYRPYLAATSAMSMNFNTITITVHPGARAGKKARITLDPPSKYIRKIINLTRTVSGGTKTRMRIRIKGRRHRDRIEISGTIPTGAPAKSYWRRISYPGWYTAFNLAYFLREQRIRVNTWPRRAFIPSKAVQLYKHTSPLLSTILQYAGKNSSNFVTEQVLKTIGAEQFKPPGSWKKGLRGIREVLKTMGIAQKKYVMQNGSGLGRGNRFSPLHIATLLRSMLNDLSIRPDFLAAQPIAGRDGTLRHRMRSGMAQGSLRAKTGTIDGVSSLSGYAQTQTRELLIFSICMNGRVKQGSIFRKIQNKIGNLLAAYPWGKGKR